MKAHMANQELAASNLDACIENQTAPIHNFQVKELIFYAGRMQGSKVLIFPGYTSEVMTQYHTFWDVMQSLRDGWIKHTLWYPAKL